MYAWDCCRLCLGVQFLHPIFSIPEHSEKYTDVIFSASGIKVESNDNLPQEMCTTCINFINNTYKFRKKCEENQTILQNKSLERPVYIVKIESDILKSETENVTIDISDLINDLKVDNNDFTNDFVESDHETKEDLAKEPVEIKFSTKKTEKPVRRRIRSKKEKKESGEKKERVKEEIECEYCHKILTSKLSLRNHNKIHTGFDVVCEHCGKKFITKRLLLMHCRAKHGYEKTDKCSYCDYRASNAEQVKIHERLHTGEKPYVCGECGAGFHRKSSYLQHIAIHLPDKTVQCDQCPARFKSVTLMRIHKNRHRAPQYTFKCRVCDNSFARRRNVARHLQRIHGLEPEQQHIHRIKITVAA